MTDLNYMLDSTGVRWVLDFATDINDIGQIVGIGTNPIGLQHGFLLTPCETCMRVDTLPPLGWRGETPLPSTLPLFATGLAGLGALAYRKKRKKAG